jgi:hypothetical protein
LSISPAVLSKTHHTSVKCVLSTALWVNICFTLFDGVSVQKASRL